MNLDKAIEILANLRDGCDQAELADHIDAIQLGIEALKRIQECRLADHTIAEDYLPGETKD